jgi:hypothetical protein
METKKALKKVLSMLDQQGSMQQNCGNSAGAIETYKIYDAINELLLKETK